MNKSKLILHSGFNGYGMNSIEFLDEAIDVIDNSFDGRVIGFEVDVNLNEESLILSHDGDFGTPFEEMINRVIEKDIVINLDIKNHNAIHILKNELNKLKLNNRFNFINDAEIVIRNKPEFYITGMSLKAIIDRYSDLCGLNYLVNIEAEEFFELTSNNFEAFDDFLNKCREYGAIGINIPKELLSEKLDSFVRSKNLFINIYTVDTVEELGKYENENNIITTNVYL